MTRWNMTRLIVFLLAAAALLGGARQQNLAQKSFVRAVLLQREAGDVQVGLIYQDVAPSADTAEAGEQLKLAVQKGTALEETFALAETLLPQKADYKLCDYLILCGTPEYSLLLEYEELLLDESEQGRLAARAYACDGELSFFETNAEEEEAFLSDWMETLQVRSESSPRLYEGAQGALLLPLLSVKQTDTPYWHSGAWLLSKDGCSQRLDENSAQLAILLCGKVRDCRLVLQGEKLELTTGKIEKHSGETGAVEVTVQAQVRRCENPEWLESCLEAMTKELFLQCGAPLEQLLGLPAVRAMAGAENRGAVSIRFVLSPARL